MGSTGTGAKVGVAAGAAVLVAALFGVSGQKQVQAANFFFPIKGEGQPGAIAKFIDPFTISNSVISESLGNIGIGTGAPHASSTSLGNVRIEGAGSGLIFADGSVVHNRAELIGPQGPQGIQGVQGPMGAVGPARSNRTDGSNRSCRIEWLQPHPTTAAAAVQNPEQ